MAGRQRSWRRNHWAGVADRILFAVATMAVGSPAMAVARSLLSGTVGSLRVVVAGSQSAGVVGSLSVEAAVEVEEPS